MNPLGVKGARHMLVNFKTACRVYRNETRLDWVVLMANVVGVAIVGLAFIHARITDTAPEATLQIATALL
ncbi:MAG: hypothetical protein ACJAWM_000767 [Sulfitobacter sp.]|jgi:hypothetical protein